MARCGYRHADTATLAATGTQAARHFTLGGFGLSPALGIPEDSVRSTSRGVWIHDIQVGDGPVVEAGDSISVHFVGFLADATTFSATDRKPFSFRLGSEKVIGGWDDGIPGMRVGGRRQLVIPPHLGYGPRGSGKIPPDAVLVFDVTLVGAALIRGSNLEHTQRDPVRTQKRDRRLRHTTRQTLPLEGDLDRGFPGKRCVIPFAPALGGGEALSVLRRSQGSSSNTDGSGRGSPCPTETISPVCTACASTALAGR